MNFYPELSLRNTGLDLLKAFVTSLAVLVDFGEFLST